jgi:hypothetical protein
MQPAHASLWLRLDTYVSLKDSGEQEQPIEESDEQTYAFCFGCL